MSTQDDLGTTITELTKQTQDMGFRQGKVISWDAESGKNVVDVGGTRVEDIPLLNRAEALAMMAGDVVGVLRVKSQYFILGKIAVDPGEIVVRDTDGNIQTLISRTPAGGGQITMYHPNGEKHASIGQLYNVSSNEVVGQGFLVQQDDGKDLLSVVPLTPGGKPLVRVFDPLGDLSFTTNSTGGWTLWAPGSSESGVIAHLSPSETDRRLMDKPYQDFALYPESTSGNVSTQVPTPNWDVIHYGRMYITHPAIHVQVTAWCEAGTGSTGQIQLRVNGQTVGTAPTFTNTNVQYFDFGGPNLLPSDVRSNPFGWTLVEVLARRTGGPGPIHVRMYGATKRGL